MVTPSELLALLSKLSPVEWYTQTRNLLEWQVKKKKHPVNLSWYLMHAAYQRFPRPKPNPKLDELTRTILHISG